MCHRGLAARWGRDHLSTTPRGKLLQQLIDARVVLAFVDVVRRRWALQHLRHLTDQFTLQVGLALGIGQRRLQCGICNLPQCHVLKDAKPVPFDGLTRPEDHIIKLLRAGLRETPRVHLVGEPPLGIVFIRFLEPHAHLLARERALSSLRFHQREQRLLHVHGAQKLAHTVWAAEVAITDEDQDHL